jgi:hypothetical protein
LLPEVPEPHEELEDDDEARQLAEVQRRLKALRLEKLRKEEDQLRKEIAQMGRPQPTSPAAEGRSSGQGEFLACLMAGLSQHGAGAGVV